jgi:hypothetical protein
MKIALTILFLSPTALALSVNPSTMSSDTSYRLTGQCYCGAVQLTAFCPPTVQAICHCSACRRMTGSLVFVTLFPPDQVTITGDMTTVDPTQNGFFMGYPKGDKVGPLTDTIDGKTKLFQPCGFSVRKACATCHASILNDHGHLLDVNGGLWDWDAGFTPAFHLNYESAILKFPNDGLPKYKDFPKDFGGSDETMEE